MKVWDARSLRRGELKPLADLMEQPGEDGCAFKSSAPDDTSTNQQVGGNENPYPASYASKPTLSQYTLYDTNDDTPEHLNYFASGTTHGPGGRRRRPKGSSGRWNCRRRGRPM